MPSGLVVRWESERKGPMPDAWISVKDRLPGVGQRVLTFDGHIVNIMCVSYDSTKGWGTWDEDDHVGFPLDLVTHWRPLPDPPKE